MRLPFRAAWSYFKRGYGEVAIPLALFGLAAQLMTLLIVGFPGLSKWLIIALLFLTGSFVASCIAILGIVNTKRKRTPYKKDVEIEMRNNPYWQDHTKVVVAMAEKVGVDASMLRRWLNE